MKKILNVLVVLFFLSIINVYSQNPCPDDPNCTPIESSSILLYGCLTVNYTIFYCTDGSYYWEIGDIIAVPPCVAYSPYQIFKDIGYEILNLPIFDDIEANVAEGDCFCNISAHTAVCYRWIYSSPSPVGFNQLIPCSTEECCYQQWCICRNEGGIHHIRNSSTFSGPCPLPPLQGCIPICEDQ